MDQRAALQEMIRPRFKQVIEEGLALDGVDGGS